MLEEINQAIKRLLPDLPIELLVVNSSPYFVGWTVKVTAQPKPHLLRGEVRLDPDLGIDSIAEAAASDIRAAIQAQEESTSGES